MNSLVASASPTFVETIGGYTVQLSVSVANVSEVIDAYHLRVYGLDPSWVEATPARLSLFPGDIGQIDLRLTVPDDYPAGLRQVSVHVQSENDPTQFALAAFSLHVAARPMLEATLDPVTITGGSRAQFGLVVANGGNSAVDVTADAVDPEELAEFEFLPATFHLLPGEQQVVQARVESKRPWVGAPKVRVLTFRATAGTRVETIGTFVQKPRIGRWMLSLLGLLLAAAVFATVISRTLNNVVDEASVGDDVVNAALDDGPVAGPGLSVNPATVTGSVVSSLTGEGIAGVQAQLYDADDGTRPLASAATATDGTFAFGGLSEGSYRLRFTGAGFSDLWYPAGRVFAEGEEIKLAPKDVLPLPPLTLGGRPGTVAGKVIADDVSGATVSLIRTGVVDSETPAVVDDVPVSADGSFVIENVPSPATYELVAERPGSARVTRSVPIAAGATVDGIEIVLRPGDGVVAGRITADGDPLGGVTVSATDGTNTLSTVSLTEERIGTYVLRNLATPGVYTVTVERPGYVPQTRTINFTEGGSVTADWALQPAVGSITGDVLDADGLPLGAVTVTLTGGDVERQTRSLSVTGAAGAVGSYRFDALPAPGTYTLTFSAEGLVNQVRLVEVGGAAGAAVEGVDVAMARSTGVIRGVVRNVDGDVVATSVVKLTNGVDTRTLQSAHEPLGSYAFSSVPAGTYTLTATLTGAAPVVTLVTITPGQVLTVDLQLGQQASLVGRVVLPDLVTPVAGRTVKLFLTSEFPSGTPVTEPVITDSLGRFEFLEVAAPENYIVAVYTADGVIVLDSEFVVSLPGTEVTVLDLVV